MDSGSRDLFSGLVIGVDDGSVWAGPLLHPIVVNAMNVHAGAIRHMCRAKFIEGHRSEDILNCDTLDIIIEVRDFTSMA